jgi:5-methylcytosine-specific restriction endonuclease McrBC GTP-binding regulatory subunit McrB
MHHPSYGYEDFIEGIKPTGLTGGEMTFALKNGVFKQMCIDAFKNLIETEKQNENNKDKKELIKAKTYYFIADEINRAELSRVFGELLLCLEDDKRLRIEGGKVLGTKVKLPNYSLWKKDEHVVVKANSNDEILDDSDNQKEWWFGVPENVYFIGTMNDIDRSVDSFDMALRRRFVWKHYKYDSEPIEKKYESINADTVEKYISVCNDLNKHIASDKGFGLSDSFELGHSYFMKPKKLTQTELDRVWLEHISPLLKEYLRTDYGEKEIIKHLDEAKKIFKF